MSVQKLAEWQHAWVNGRRKTWLNDRMLNVPIELLYHYQIIGMTVWSW